MAESPITLTELITINDRNLQDVDIPNFLNSAPFMRTNAATIASHDTIHKWLQFTNPPVGWRSPNDGREVQSSTDVRRQADLRILDASFRTDLALARNYRKGGMEAWLNREAARHLDASFFEAETQIFNGRAAAINDPDDAGYYTDTGTGQGDATGPNGLPNWNFLGAIGSLCISAGGTATRSSIWLIRSGDTDVEILTGNEGDIAIGESSVQETAGATGTYPGLYTPITSWYGLKVGSDVTSAVRICNIDSSGGTGTAVDDDMIYDAMAVFGSGRPPTHIYMNRTVRNLLRKSRTAINQTGAPAPVPTQIEGIPIIATDGITNAEAAVI